MKHLRPLCSHCIFWAADYAANPPTMGHCHRYPPNVFVNPETGTIVQKFPSTDQHHWCGEWNGDESRFTLAVRRSVVEKAAQPGPLAE